MRYEIDGGILTDIADAIREKTGKSALITPEDMPDEIDGIEGYPEPTGTMEITQNGTVDVKDYAQAAVSVPNSYAAADEGKVVSNGALVQQTSRTVTENGTYDTTLISSLAVNVSGDSGYNGWTALTDYIQSSGTQYINTGYIVKDSTRFAVVANVQTTQSNTYPTIWGARPSNTPSRTCGVFPKQQSTLNVRRGWANSSDYAFAGAEESGATFGAKVLFWHEKTNTRILTADGQVSGGIFPASGDPQLDGYPIYICAMNEGNAAKAATFCAAKIYAFRVYEGANMVMDLLPYEDDGEACLKDSITGALFKNGGSGSFIFGTDT